MIPVNIRFYLKVFLINLFLIFFVILIIELIFGNWLKTNNYGNIIIPRYVTNIINDPPYKSNISGIYSRDKYGFRANHHELKDINILVIGGSTTEERDVDDKLIWTKVLENNLSDYNRYKVLNAGIGGQTSFGHVKIFNLWFSRFEKLQPNIIFFYIGINDTLFMLESIKHKNHIFQGRVIKSINRDNIVYENILDNTVQYIKNNSSIHLLYLVLRGNYISRKYKVNYNNINTFDLPKVYIEDISTNINTEEKNFSFYLEAYENNLNTLIQLTKKYNAKPVFITQKIAKDHWLMKYISLINKRTIKFCVDNNVSFIDLENIIKFDDLKDLYDGIHTTPSGSKKVGYLISEYIISN